MLIENPLAKDKISKHKRTFLSFLIEDVLFQSWWVVLFFLFCHIAYDQTYSYWKKEFDRLNHHLLEIKKEKESTLELQAELQRQINSQSDHAWIELILMKGLGLVPEGETKVFFTEK